MELMDSAVSPGTLRSRHKEATRIELRRAAFELFETKGYARTSVDEIAQAAGVSRSTFFRYFPTKEEVLELDDRENALMYLKMLRERPKSEGRLKALEETLVAYALAIRTDERREELKTRQSHRGGGRGAQCSEGRPCGSVARGGSQGTGRARRAVRTRRRGCARRRDPQPDGRTDRDPVADR